MSLADKLLRWRELEIEKSLLEKQIEEEVIPLGQTQSVENVVAEYRASDKNGSYDYEGMGNYLSPSSEMLEQFTVYPEPYVEWKKLVERMNPSEVAKDMFYKAPVGGNPKVTVKLKK